MSRSLVGRPIRIGPAPNARRGAAVVLLLGALVVLLGVGALALNLTWLSTHQVELREACESAALAGAAELLDPAAGASVISNSAVADRVNTATDRALEFFSANSSVTVETTGSDPDMIAGWCDDPTEPGAEFTPWTGTGFVNSLSVRGVCRQSNGDAVLLWFGGLFGVGSAEPASAARASMDQRIYGFRPLEIVPAPVVPLLTPSTIRWPSGGAGTASGLPDHFSVHPRTGTVSGGADGIAEITLLAPLASGTLPSGQPGANWLRLLPGAMDYRVLATQVAAGLTANDLTALGSQFALGSDNTLLVPPAPAPGEAEGDVLLTALLAIRGKRRVWPLGGTVTVNGQLSCQVTGFAAGCVVDCSRNSNYLTIVVQATTFQTCTGLLRSGTARNPWIGKLILNE
jgi:hypothetical protein